MDPDPKIVLSNFVVWTTSPSDILPPGADLKISFGRNGESFDVGSPLKRCDDVWTDLGLGLMVPASGILAVDVLQAGYSVPNLENSDRTYSKLGSVYIDLGELLDISDDISNPEMTMSGAARYATTVVMEADYLPVLHCSMAVTRFSSLPVDDSLNPLYMPFQMCAEEIEISDDEFKRCAEELESFLGASDGGIILTLITEQVADIFTRCLIMQDDDDRIHLTALFAGLLNDQFLLRSRIQTRFLAIDPRCYERQMFVFSRFLYEGYGIIVGHLDGSHQTDFSDGLLNLPDTNPTKTLLIQSFGRGLTDRYSDAKDENGLTRAIFCLETVERLRLDAYASDFVLDQYELYDCMFDAYYARYSISENVLDIDKALLSSDKARKLRPPGWQDQQERCPLLFRTALTFCVRYDQSHDRGDLSKAKELVGEGLALSPRDSPTYLTHLEAYATVLLEYCKMDETANREPAILCHEELLSLLPRGDPTVARGTSALMELYSLGGNYDRAIKLGRDFVNSNPNHPDINLLLTALGQNLVSRYIRPVHDVYEDPSCDFPDMEDRRDLDEAIALLSRDPRGGCNLDLARALFFRYRFGGNHISDLRAGISIASRTATSPNVSPLEQYSAAKMWASQAEHLPCDECQSSGMTACRIVMSLLPGLLWMGIGLQDRHHILAVPGFHRRPYVPKDKQEYQSACLGQIPNETAAFAIRYGEYHTAIEWLEQGRSISWDQMLQLRVPMESLQLVDKELAEKLRAIGRELAISTARSGSWATRMDEAGKEHEAFLEAEGQKHRRLTHDWETGVAEVRRLPSFENFLASKPFAYLSRAADDCTVVIINTDRIGVDALVMFPPGSDGHDTDILHIPFPGTYAELLLMQRLIVAVPTQLSSSRKWQEYCPTPTTPLLSSLSSLPLVRNETLKLGYILNHLWYEIVLPILVCCNQARPDLFSGSPGVARPRVRWCPTGPLSFLPLHAAGDYTNTAFHRGHKVYDFVISSYIPTLNSIIRDHPIPSNTYVSGTKPKILAVSCAAPKGHPPIQGADKELDEIKKRADLADCELTAVTEQHATADRVLEEIKDAHWVHFACHGVQDTEHPTQSALILQNGTRATLSDFAALDLPHAELAYLSACQTATGYDAIPSESIHLAAGMLLAGFRSVIATMWPIQDRYAPDVADSVYGYLLRGGQGSTPDYKESAVALDLAVQRLRDEVGETDFISWVPYIHIGV